MSKADKNKGCRVLSVYIKSSVGFDRQKVAVDGLGKGSWRS